MKRTRREAISLCREVWKELAESGGSRKSDSATFCDEGIAQDIGGCTLCQYVYDLTDKRPASEEVPDGICEAHCPFVWPEGTCYKGEALYYRWMDSPIEDTEGRKAIAAKIASLPTKKIR